MRQHWDAISCVWTLHHLPDRTVLSAALRQVAQLRDQNGSTVWLLDFHRLRSAQTFPAIVGVLDADLAPVLRADGVASEAAAFTHDELREALAEAGLDDLNSGRARPIPWMQAFWSGGGNPRAVPRRGSVDRLRRSARVDATILRLGFSRLPRRGPFSESAAL